MARKPASTPRTVSKKPISSTAVRNTAVPRTTAAALAKPVLTQELIAQRAYFISISGFGGSQDENWFRAEAELRRELGL